MNPHQTIIISRVFSVDSFLLEHTIRLLFYEASVLTTHQTFAKSIRNSRQHIATAFANSQCSFFTIFFWLHSQLRSPNNLARNLVNSERSTHLSPFSDYIPFILLHPPREGPSQIHKQAIRSLYLKGK